MTDENNIFVSPVTEPELTPDEIKQRIAAFTEEMRTSVEDAKKQGLTTFKLKLPDLRTIAALREAARLLKEEGDNT